jgi:hypothetical protein
MYKYLISTIFVAGTVIFLLIRDKKPVSASAETFIQASLERVWNIQSNISEWKNWNSDIESMNVDGEVGIGTIFRWKTGGITIESKISEFVPEQRIAWEGRTFGINAYHIWEFSEGKTGVHVYTQERFTGIFAWFLPGTMRNQILKALNHGVLVLKQEAERENAKP